MLESFDQAVDGDGPARPRSQGEAAYEALKEAILSGKLAAGTRLVEAEVGKELGVSRTPVREALRRLTVEGFVSRQQNRGLVVHRPTAREIESVYQIREVLDGLAARLAARRAIDVELARLDLALDAVKEAAEAEALDEAEASALRRMVSANIAVHDLLYRMSGSQRLIRMSREVRDSVRLFSRDAFASAERAVEIVGEHAAIVEAVRRRDPDAAEWAAREHLRNARRYLILRLTERETDVFGD